MLICFHKNVFTIIKAGVCTLKNATLLQVFGACGVKEDRNVKDLGHLDTKP